MLLVKAVVSAENQAKRWGVHASTRASEKQATCRRERTAARPLVTAWSTAVYMLPLFWTLYITY